MELNFPSLAALVVETAGANWPTSRKNALIWLAQDARGLFASIGRDLRPPLAHHIVHSNARTPDSGPRWQYCP